MWSFQDLLRLGRSQLSHIQGPNITGVEEGSLVEPYYSTLLELNNYMYTTGSTNYPNQLFQPMWLTGWLPRSKALALGRYLRSLGLNYIIQAAGEEIKTEVGQDWEGQEVVHTTYGMRGEVLDHNLTPNVDLLNPQDVPTMIEYGVGLLPYELYPHVEGLLYDPIDPIVGIVIEDPILERRNLFDLVLNFLRKNPTL